MPAVVSVVEVIKNAEVDLRLGITADGRIVVVIRELVQCALLMSERGAQRFLSDPANQDLAQTIGMVALETARWHGAKSDQVTCDVKHVETVLDWAVEGHGGINVMVQEQRAKLVAAVHKAACDLFSRVPRQQDCSAGVKSVVARKLPRKGGASSRWYRGRAWTAARRGAVGVACAANSRIPPGHR